MQNSPSPPTEQQARQARLALSMLRHVNRDKTSVQMHINREGGGPAVAVSVPADAFALWMEMLDHFAKGHAVSVVPVYAEVTTQQAADLLNVSRPYLIRRLESGEIPFRMVGTHRRIRVVDVLAFKNRDDLHRERILDDLGD